jgi:hypothetical protein
MTLARAVDVDTRSHGMWVVRESAFRYLRIRLRAEAMIWRTVPSSYRRRVPERPSTSFRQHLKIHLRERETLLQIRVLCNDSPILPTPPSIRRRDGAVLDAPLLPRTRITSLDLDS